MNKRLPPYGKPLAERLRFGNLPFHVFVCIGQDAWSRAKRWSAGPNDTPGLVLPPGINPYTLRWPVTGCMVIIDWDIGPSERQVIELVRVNLEAGANSVTTYPRFAVGDGDIYAYDTEKKRWMQRRETFRTYIASKEILSSEPPLTHNPRRAIV